MIRLEAYTAALVRRIDYAIDYAFLECSVPRCKLIFASIVRRPSEPTGIPSILKKEFGCLVQNTLMITSKKETIAANM